MGGPRWHGSGTTGSTGSVGRRQRVYAIDTPPPTVSGGCTSDTCSRTPIRIRWPATGGCAASGGLLPDEGSMTTGSRRERGCKTTNGVLCDPSLRKDPSSSPRRSREAGGGHLRARTSSTCAPGCEEDERVFENLWRTLGLSVTGARRTPPSTNRGPGGVSQQGFLHLLAKGHAYSTGPRRSASGKRLTCQSAGVPLAADEGNGTGRPGVVPFRRLRFAHGLFVIGVLVVDAWRALGRIERLRPSFLARTCCGHPVPIPN